VLIVFLKTQITAKDGINSSVRLITDQETIAPIKYKIKSSIIDLGRKKVNDNNDDEVMTLYEDDKFKKKSFQMDDDASTILDSQSVISESKRGKIMVGNTIQKLNVIPVTGNQSMETHLTPSASSNVDQIPSGKQPKSKETMGKLLAATCRVDKETTTNFGKQKLKKDEGSGKKPKSMETLNQELASTQGSNIVINESKTEGNLRKEIKKLGIVDAHAKKRNEINNEQKNTKKKTKIVAALNHSATSKAKKEFEGKSDLVDTEKLHLLANKGVISNVCLMGSSGCSMRKVDGWNKTSVAFVNWNQYRKHTKMIDAEMRRFTEVTKCQYITFYSTENVSL